MTVTAILIALVILIFWVVVRFVANKRTTLAMLRKLTGLPIPFLDRIVDEHMNLPPGTVVQCSGNYESIICANDSVPDAWTTAHFGKAEARRRA
jgi:hypothetical protein